MVAFRQIDVIGNRIREFRNFLVASVVLFFGASVLVAFILRLWNAEAATRTTVEYFGLVLCLLSISCFVRVAIQAWQGYAAHRAVERGEIAHIEREGSLRLRTWFVLQALLFLFGMAAAMAASFARG